MLESGQTFNPYYSQIALAQMINRISGGVVIEPWNVYQLPDDWLDAFRLLATDGKQFEKVKKIVMASKANWLKKFNYYRN